jgi:hypothetical protein
MQAVRSNSFNPYNYSTDQKYRNDESIITSWSYDDGNYNDSSYEASNRGDSMLKVDLAYFDKLCGKFRNTPDKRIKDLSGQEREEFNLMVSYVHVLYETENYKKLHNIVKKYFTNLPNVKTGTIGGYFGGCLVQNDFDGEKGCSLTCAGSVPRPKDEEGWGFCDKAVIFAERSVNGKGYDFTLLKESGDDNYSNDEPCYVFIENKDAEGFKGFNEKEKAKLRKMGAKDIFLVGCDEKENKYYNIYNEPISIDIGSGKSTKSKTVSQSYAIGGIVLIILLMGAILWVMRNKQR